MAFVLMFSVMLATQLIGPVRCASTTRVYVDPPYWEGGVGSTFSIDVVVEDVPDLYAWEVKLLWDNSLLNCTAEEYPFLPPGLNWEAPNNIQLGPGIEQNYNETHGRWYHALSAFPMAAPFPEAFTGTIELATLTFEVKARGSCTLTFVDVALRGLDRTTTTVYPRWSDINDDGVIDIYDVVIVAVAFGSKPGDPNWNQAADLNDDGKVDITEVVILASDFGKYVGGPLWGISYTVYDIPATLEGGIVIIPVPPTLRIKLSGEFDYLPDEPIKVRLAALVTDADTFKPIPGADVTLDIYDPEGNLLISDKMVERLALGVYEWESKQTIRWYVQRGIIEKGVYLVHVQVSYLNESIASDILEFHIDPSPEGPNTTLIVAIVAFIGAVATSLILLRQPIKRLFKPVIVRA